MKTLARLFSLAALGVGAGALGLSLAAWAWAGAVRAESPGRRAAAAEAQTCAPSRRHIGLHAGGACARSVVVVELFTAQGCASCKQANRLIARLADRPGVIALTWSVDYWDYLGWKDTFAQPPFTARQRAYARRLGPRDVYTPQIVVGGAAQVSGDDTPAVEALVRAAERPRRGRPLKVRMTDGGWVTVGAAARLPLGVGPRARADVWLVRFDPRPQDVTVTAGDNRGASVVHRDVVRELSRLGPWSGRAESFKAPPASEAGLATAVIVQAAHGGPIIAAALSPAVPEPAAAPAAAVKAAPTPARPAAKAPPPPPSAAGDHRQS
jgi:hypothetical protein